MIFIGLVCKDSNKERNTPFIVNKIVTKKHPSFEIITTHDYI